MTLLLCCCCNRDVSAGFVSVGCVVCKQCAADRTSIDWTKWREFEYPPAPSLDLLTPAEREQVEKSRREQWVEETDPDALIAIIDRLAPPPATEAPPCPTTP